MIMAVTATGVAGQIFLKCADLHQGDILRDCTALSLKCPYTGRIELMQRPSADTTHNNGIDMMPAKSCNGIACTVLMNLIAVANRLKFTGGHIYNHKLGC